MDSANTEMSKTPRGRFQFSLRSLLIVVTICAVVLALTRTIGFTWIAAIVSALTAVGIELFAHWLLDTMFGPFDRGLFGLFGLSVDQQPEPEDSPVGVRTETCRDANGSSNTARPNT